MPASRSCIALLAGLMLLAGCHAAPKVVSTRSMLDEMVVLGGLAEYPDPAFICRQASSFDPRSESPDDHDAWFANQDWGQFIRAEERDGRVENVMLDVAGPGAIVRIWSANPKGTLRVYLDHAEEPVIEAPMTALLGGKVPGLPEPIAGVRSAGWNLIFPIPYAEHCKVTSDEGDFYYHVNYRTYEDETVVETFRAADLEKLTNEIADIAHKLAQPRECHLKPLGEMDEGAALDDIGPVERLAPGERLTWPAKRSGPGAIDELCVRVMATDVQRALRQCVLTIAFDGHETVKCPLGDFFGGGLGVNPYRSLPMGVTADGALWSRWVMPYRNAAVVTIHNRGDQPVEIVGALATRPYRWTERTMYFNAGWRIDRDIPSRPMRDWNYVTIDGRGVFVGASFAISNPVRNWWGEGDEKIYIDGEKFPSTFGTGTEDYFGYAWCSPMLFTHAYHNQPRCDGPSNYGHTSVNRWHVLDRLPFAHDFRFDMELWHSNANTKMTCSVVTYWYGDSGTHANYPELNAADLVPPVVPEFAAPRVSGAIEGEKLRVLSASGKTHKQVIEGCSNLRHLWWTDGQPGEKLAVEFDAPADGKYRVFGRFVTAHDYGIVQVSINGEPAGGPMDFYTKGVQVTPEHELGTFTLQQRGNTCVLEIVGKNKNAAARYMAGLDYLRLERVE